MKRLACLVILILLVDLSTAQTPEQNFSYPFAQYPAHSLFKGKPVPPKLTTPTQREFRTVLRKGAQKGPNFAGHYTVVEWGCGSNCIVFAVVDAANGVVYERDMPATSDRYPCGLLYRRDSTLFVVEKSASPTGDCEPTLYNWNGSQFVLLGNPERTPQT